MGYNVGTTTFAHPITHTDEDGQVYAADMYRCPYNVSTAEYPLCNASAAQSIYVDPNVPTEQYDFCNVIYIGDGVCGM